MFCFTLENSLIFSKRNTFNIIEGYTYLNIKLRYSGPFYIYVVYDEVALSVNNIKQFNYSKIKKSHLKMCFIIEENSAYSITRVTRIIDLNFFVRNVM